MQLSKKCIATLTKEPGQVFCLSDLCLVLIVLMPLSSLGSLNRFNAHVPEQSNFVMP